jgi:hypothetical protein
VESAVAVNAERHQVFFGVISGPTAESLVMDVEIRHRSAVLAPPVITLKHLLTFLVFARG